MDSIYQSIEILSKEKGIDSQIVLDAVKDALSKQRIVWVATDPLASLRVQANDRCGLKPAAVPVTKPDENRRPAS